MKTLEEYIKGKSFKELMKLYRDIMDGKTVLEDPSPPQDFLEYLMRPDYSLWLWTALGLTILTLISILLSQSITAFAILRYILGSVFVLFLPGYTTIEALYPREKDLSNLERLALSIGLSLAIAPIIGLILNYTPWGIRMGPIITTLSIYIIILLFIAAFRKYSEIQRNTSKYKNVMARNRKK